MHRRMLFRFLQHDDRIVNVDCGAGSGDLGMLHVLFVIPMVHVVHEATDIGKEIRRRPEATAETCPIGRVKILDQIDAIVVEKRKQGFKRGFDIVHAMAAVIDDDIDAAHLLDHRSEKCRVVLRTDAHLAVDTVKLEAVLVDVDPVDGRVRPKELAPDRKRAALRHTDFQQPWRAASEGCEIAVIDRDVVVPFVNQMPRMLRIYLQKIAIITVSPVYIFMNARAAEFEFVDSARRIPCVSPAIQNAAQNAPQPLQEGSPLVWQVKCPWISLAGAYVLARPEEHAQVNNDLLQPRRTLSIQL